MGYLCEPIKTLHFTMYLTINDDEILHSVYYFLLFAVSIMGKNKDISTEKVAQIVILRQEGLTQQAISARLGINQSIVSRQLSRHATTGTYSAKKRTGRPRLTSAQTDRMIHRMAVSNPRISSSAIASVLPERISSVTVRRRLVKDFNLKSFRPAAKPKLSPKNVRDRLAFCRRYSHWTPEDWSAVMFSDECTIRQFSLQRPYVRRPPGQRFNNRYTCSTVKHSPSLMVWGSIAAAGRGGLWFAPPNSTITATTYLSIIQEKLPTFMPLRRCTVFQHDGAPVHTARLIKNWMADYFPTNGFTFLEGWPGNSPDLNVIENCWVMLKRKVAALNPTSLDDLKEKIKLVWTQHITQDYCERLVQSMPRRIAAVLANRGHSTKY